MRVKRNCTIALVAVIELVLLAGCAKKAVNVDTNPKARYQGMVQRLRSGDRSVDLNDLRLTAAEAGIVSDTAARRALVAATRTTDAQKIAEAADAVLASNYTDLDGHFFAKFAAAQLGKADRTEFHNWVEMGLLKSLRSNGNGRSPEAAMKVVSTDEEFFVIRMFQEELKQQTRGTCAGQPCDILTTIDPGTKQPITRYFNVEIPLRRQAAGQAAAAGAQPVPAGSQPPAGKVQPGQGGGQKPPVKTEPAAPKTKPGK